MKAIRPGWRSTIACLVAMHAVAAVLAVAAVRDPSAGAPLLGGIAVAYVWGLQHGFAADHIAAIDDSTRLLVARGGRRAGSAGLAFATGHGITVSVAVIMLVALTNGATPVWIETGALLFAVAFLSVVAVVNARMLRRLAARRPVGDQRSVLTRLGGERLRARIGRPAHLIPVGMVFGVASFAEVFAIVVVGQGGLDRGLLVPLALVVTFSTGLTLVDAADSMLMARAYRWADGDPARRRFATLTATSLTVVVSAFVVAVLTASLLVDAFGQVPAPIAGLATLAQRFELIGAIAVALFTVWWAAAWSMWRRGCARAAEPPASRPPSRTLPVPSGTAP